METSLNNIMFFQKHKKELPQQNNSSLLSVAQAKPKVSKKASFCLPPTPISQLLPEIELTIAQGSKKIDRSKSGMKVYQKFKPSLEQQSPFLNTTAFEYNSDRMQYHFNSMSKNYDEKCIDSGYPPKIVALLIKQLTEGKAKSEVQVLDVGCGKGQLGQYLRKDGFSNISGIEMSKSLIEMAIDFKAYKAIEKAVIGQYQWKLGFEANSTHSEKYDFVVAPSMINNEGWDGDIFKQLLNLTKMGGTIIFATKLSLDQNDIYSEYIQNLTTEHFWRPIKEHSFYKYDLQCDGSGKFSNKMVKIMAFEKTDHNNWVKIQNELNQKALKDVFEKEKVQKMLSQAILNKLNGAEIARNVRIAKKLQDTKEAQDDEEIAFAQQKLDEEEFTRKQISKKVNRDRMMANLKIKIKELMWIKLKENQKKEVEKLKVLQREATIKRMESFKNKNLQAQLNIKIQLSDSSPTKFNPSG